MATQPPRHRKPWRKKDVQQLKHLAKWITEEGWKMLGLGTEGTMEQ
jgi:hypothetical protein